MAGVGESTVVRALRGTGYVSEETKARVLDAAAALDYQPNQQARILRLGKSGYVALVAWHMQSHVFQAALSSLARDIRDAGYNMLFYASVSEDIDTEEEYVDELLGKRVAGALISPTCLSPRRETYQRLLDKGVKLVIMDKIVEELAAPHVVIDQYASSRLATEHLISLGHRDIVHLAIGEESPTGRHRAAGFRDAMLAAEIPIDESSTVQTELYEEGGARAVAELLRRDRLPTALVARHDSVAIGAMQALFQAGFSIPDDISIVGHGDIWPTHALRVPLTTIRAPMNQLALTAMQRLLGMLAGQPSGDDFTFIEVELVIRSSTAPPNR